MNYRPILACQVGAVEWLPMKLLMYALVWPSSRGSISTICKPPGCAEAVVYGHEWPNYGFDEWFLQTAVYPRAAMDGIMSFIPTDAKCRILPIDVAHCQQANAASELVYFGPSAGGCCGPASDTSFAKQHAGYWRTSEGLGHLANHIGLVGQGMEICRDEQSLADTMAPHWAGSSWTAFAAKPATVKVEAKRLVAGKPGKISKKPLSSVAAVPSGSQDIVWLPSGGGFDDMVALLDTAWDKVAVGGILGGGEMMDTFEGSPYGKHRWLCTKQAVLHWAKQAGVEPHKGSG